MAESKAAQMATRAVVSRRDAIVGALALAAGALIATRPEEALAADGATVTVGGIFAGTLPTVLWHTASGSVGPVISQALLAGTNVNGVEYGVDGEVSAVSTGAGVGVRGSAATMLQYGVLAENTAAGGIALKINGLAQFSRSGKATVSKGKSSGKVTGLSNISSSSLILITLQGSAGTGIHVLYAKRMNSTSFEVVLSKAATAAVSFAWLILN